MAIMWRHERKGFTLIELLVVIAIIGILAAMLFPVFARAREAARKIQCLSNVKNVTMAMVMYLTDYDKFPPNEHDPSAVAYLEQRIGRCGCDAGTCQYLRSANPYLRWPVILDEYIKNRDVWRCPSAKVETGGAAFMIPIPDWLTYMKNHEGEWGVVGGLWIGPCSTGWPAGWGGEITDSLVQGGQLASGSRGAFIQTIGQAMGHTGYESLELNPGTVSDPSWYAVFADAGVLVDLWSPVLTAYPEICRLVCINCPADWEGCPDSQDCGAGGDNYAKYFTDVTTRKPYARHLGGSNIGFMDGHAKWMSAEAILDAAGTMGNPGQLQGMGPVFPTHDCPLSMNPDGPPAVTLR
jgi:prepilin-type N-terminal cleavage/methylation domain-containing protein/prepilin-type processing-associated H-X9-DG protein